MTMKLKINKPGQSKMNKQEKRVEEKVQETQTDTEIHILAHIENIKYVI